MNNRNSSLFKETPYSVETPSIAIVLTHLEYSDIPFAHLSQLDKIGLVNIYILLDENETKKAEGTKFVVFDYTKPITILEHYQSQSSRLKFKVMNTGKTTTEEEKLYFYLQNVQEHHLMNIILCKQALPWSTDDLRAKPRCNTTVTREYPYFSYFNNTEHQIVPSSTKPCSSEKAMALLQRNINPCICYQVGFWDILNYQWIYNIFVELIAFYPNEATTLNTLIKEHNNNAIALNKAQEAFNKTCFNVYKTFDKPNCLLKWTHENNRRSRDDLEINSLKIINELIQLHNEVALKEQNANDRKKPVVRVMKL